MHVWNHYLVFKLLPICLCHVSIFHTMTPPSPGVGCVTSAQHQLSSSWGPDAELVHMVLNWEQLHRWWWQQNTQIWIQVFDTYCIVSKGIAKRLSLKWFTPTLLKKKQKSTKQNPDAWKHKKCVVVAGRRENPCWKQNNHVPNELSWLHYNIPTKNRIFFIVKSSLWVLLLLGKVICQNRTVFPNMTSLNR